MIIDEKKIKAESTKCLLTTRNRKRRCFAKDCKDNAINSHVLWKKGVLDLIAEKSHLIELNVTRNHNYEELKFSKTGINRILTFSGFCNYHDSKIFKEIEADNVDFKITSNQILFSVRSIFFERVKKEQNVEYFICLLRKRLFPFPEQIQAIGQHIEMQKLGIKDMIYYITELNNEYFEPKGRFIFKYYEVEKLPVACSCIFNVDSNQKMHQDSISNPNWANEPLNSIIFNIFPSDKKSIIILGYHSSFLSNISITNTIEQLSENDFKKLISDILIERAESWVCTPSYYEENIKKIEETVMADFSKSATTFTGAVNNDLINIFESINV